jgi:hypothetical protein
MNKMGKIDTNTILLVGAAAVAIYFFTRPKVPTYNPYAANPYGLPNTALNVSSNYGNPVAQDITASGSALEGISSILGNFF